MPQDAGQKRKRGRRAGWAGPLIEKVTEVVGRVVPERLLPVCFAGALVVVLVLFVLMIVGFSGDPAEAAKWRIERLGAQIEKLEEGLKGERREHGVARGETRKATRHAQTLEYELGRMKKQLPAVEKRVQDLRKQLQAAQEDYRKESEGARVFKQAAEREKRSLTKDRDKALRDLKVATERQTGAEGRLASLQKQHDELRAEKDEAKKAQDRARLAFESIIKKADAIEDPEKKIRAVERLRAASHLDLEGTVYMERLDEKIKRERRVSRVEAKVAYARYMDRLEMTHGYDAKMALLAEAKKEFEDRDETAYARKIDAEITSRRTRHEDEVAREVRDQVMRDVALRPKAYKENLKALEVALEKTKGTRWVGAIQKQVDSRRRTLADDVARVLYEDLVSRVRLNPKGYDENLDYAAEMRPRITPRYEKKFAKQVAAVEKTKLDAAGRSALSDAQEHVARNPTDHEGNIRALIEFKSRARGSRYEGKLADMLARERKLLLRSGK